MQWFRCRSSRSRAITHDTCAYSIWSAIQLERIYHNCSDWNIGFGLTKIRVADLCFSMDVGGPCHCELYYLHDWYHVRAYTRYAIHWCYSWRHIVDGWRISESVRNGSPSYDRHMWVLYKAYLLLLTPFVDGVLAFAYIALIFLIPRVPSASKQRVAVYIWCFTILLLFSVLLSLFRLKNTSELLLFRG